MFDTVKKMRDLRKQGGDPVKIILAAPFIAARKEPLAIKVISEIACGICEITDKIVEGCK